VSAAGGGITLISVKRWIGAVVRDRELSLLTRLIACYIGALHDFKKGYAHPSLDRIAADTGASRRTVQNAVDRLRQRGWIAVKGGRGRGHASEYVIDPEAPKRVNLSAPFKAKKSGNSSAPFPGQEKWQNEALKVAKHPPEKVQPICHPTTYVEDSNATRVANLQLRSQASDRSGIRGDIPPAPPWRWRSAPRRRLCGGGTGAVRWRSRPARRWRRSRTTNQPAPRPPNPQPLAQRAGHRYRAPAGDRRRLVR
jgi:biotin operon repressor